MRKRGRAAALVEELSKNKDIDRRDLLQILSAFIVERKAGSLPAIENLFSICRGQISTRVHWPSPSSPQQAAECVSPETPLKRRGVI